MNLSFGHALVARAAVGHGSRKGASERVGRRGSRRQPTWSALVAVTVALGGSGCGEGDPRAADAPSNGRGVDGSTRATSPDDGGGEGSEGEPTGQPRDSGNGAGDLDGSSLDADAAAIADARADVATGDTGSDAGPVDGDAGILGATPSMGWESWWSTHTCNPSEAEVKAIADVVASKFKQFGYEYILIDDCWYSGFDAYGRWKPNPTTFPDGWSGAADYVHGKGLKIGIYLVPGVLDPVVAANSPIMGPNGLTTYHAQDIVTSAAGNTDKNANQAHKLNFSNPGAVAFVQGYAQLIASWGADAVKMDFVGPGGGGGNADNRDDITQWRAALDATGRRIVLNLSNQLDIAAIGTWEKYSNSWRVSTDIECYCSTDTDWTHVEREIFGLGTTRGLLNPNFVPYAGPGHWNDLDSLMIGEGSFDGITIDERQTQFSFWSIVGSPLIIGSDLTRLDAGDYAILTNSEVIAVNQSGLPAKPVSTASNQQVWYTKQADGSIVVGLFNFGAVSAQVAATFSAVGAGTTMKVHDMISHADLGSSTGSFGATLPTHASRMLRLTAP
jgi:hypothetical protein